MTRRQYVEVTSADGQRCWQTSVQVPDQSYPANRNQLTVAFHEECGTTKREKYDDAMFAFEAWVHQDFVGQPPQINPRDEGDLNWQRAQSLLGGAFEQARATWAEIALDLTREA